MSSAIPGVSLHNHNTSGVELYTTINEMLLQVEVNPIEFEVSFVMSYWLKQR